MGVKRPESREHQVKKPGSRERKLSNNQEGFFNSSVDCRDPPIFMQ